MRTRTLQNIYIPLSPKDMLGVRHNMWLELLVFIIGLVYGYAKPGKEDRWALLKKGAIYGIILGVVFGLIGFFAGSYLGSVAGGLLFFAGSTIFIFISVVILVIIFIVGTFIGDALEGILK
jgi:hypothetical protein